MTGQYLLYAKLRYDLISYRIKVVDNFVFYILTMKATLDYVPELNRLQAKQIVDVLRSKQFSCGSDLKDLLGTNAGFGLGSIMKVCENYEHILAEIESSQRDEDEMRLSDEVIRDRNSEALMYYSLGHFSAARRLWSQVRYSYL